MEEIAQSNKKIAFFMDHDLEYMEDTPSFGSYHEEWSWLMPVVEKIESIGLFEVLMRQYMVQVRNNNPFQMFKISTQVVNEEQNKLTATYKVVVAFLEWYEKVEVRMIEGPLDTNPA